MRRRRSGVTTSSTEAERRRSLQVPVGSEYGLCLFVELEWIFPFLFYFCTSFEYVMDDFYLKGSYVCLCVT